MEKVTLNRKRWKGEFAIYQFGEDGCPAINEEWHLLQAGDYIRDVKGVVAPILQAYACYVKANSCTYFIIVTPFGTDYVVRLNKGGSFKRVALDLKRPRSSFWSFSRSGKTELTIKEIQWLKHIFRGINVYDAYRYVYQTNVANSLIQRKLSTVMKIPAARELMAKTLSEVIGEKGLNAEWFVDKLIKSIGEEIDSDLKLDMFKMLGIATGEGEIQHLVDPESTPVPPPQLPSLTRKALKEVPNASFEEVSPPANEEKLKV